MLKLSSIYLFRYIINIAIGPAFIARTVSSHISWLLTFVCSGQLANQSMRCLAGILEKETEAVNQSVWSMGCCHCSIKVSWRSPVVVVDPSGRGHPSDVA